MTLWNDIKKGFNNPREVLRILKRNPRKIFAKLKAAIISDILRLHAKFYRDILGRKGLFVMDREWDNLIILDACRYDLFEEYNTIPGELKQDTSAAGATAEFLEKNFSNGSYPDTVYITSNPNCYYMEADFHAVEHVWRDHWNEELETVTPEVFTDVVLEIINEYPNKRFIIHYIQPHYPFIGPTGKEIDHSTLMGQGLIAETRNEPTIWERMKNGNVSTEEGWTAYRENLELTLPHVQRLIAELNGKTVITSDHGNAFGEWGLYGHSVNVFHPKMVEVPWLEVDYDERRDVEPGSLADADEQTTDINERLSALGYK